MLACVSPLNDANALLDSLTKATKFEQLTQIAIAEEQQRALFQMLETAEIAAALWEVFSDLDNLSNIMEAILKFEVPERFTQDYETLSLPEYNALTKERMAFLEQAYRDIDELSADIALDTDQIAILTQAGRIASDPTSDITATQAQILQDIVAQEQRKRADALQILREKRNDIEKQMELGHSKAFNSALDCFNNSKLCGR